MEEKKLWMILSVVLLSSTFLDIYTALRSPIFEIAEANPLYMKLRNVVYFTTILLLVTFYFVYRLKKALSLNHIFAITLFFVYATFGHAIGVYSNITSHNNFVEQYGYIESPEKTSNPQLTIKQNEVKVAKFKVEFEQQYTPEDKANNYLLIIGGFVFIPMLFSIITFYLTKQFYTLRKTKRQLAIRQIKKLAVMLED